MAAAERRLSWIIAIAITFKLLDLSFRNSVVKFGLTRAITHIFEIFTNSRRPAAILIFFLNLDNFYTACPILSNFALKHWTQKGYNPQLSI
jgi:hypothetical protein